MSWITSKMHCGLCKCVLYCPRRLKWSTMTEEVGCFGERRRDDESSGSFVPERRSNSCPVDDRLILNLNERLRPHNAVRKRRGFEMHDSDRQGWAVMVEDGAS